MELREQIKSAFEHRKKPMILSTSASATMCEYTAKEINNFADKSRYEINCNVIEDSFDGIASFTGDAYCYFLPGILLAGIESNNRNLLAFSSIIFSLDRSPVVEYWDLHFLSRWPLLSTTENLAMQGWLQWYFDAEYDLWGNTHERCFETLELLKSQRKAKGRSGR